MASRFSLRLRVCVLFLASAASLAILELLARAVAPPLAANDVLNQEILRDDAVTLFHLRSNVDLSMGRIWPGCRVRLRTNSTGQRMDQELPGPAAPRRYRIVTIGDSCTMGWGVDVRFAYPARLGQKLAAEGHPETEVLNFGTVGYTSYCGRLQLEAEILALHPDLVTVALGFNDWFESDLSDAARHQALLARLDYEKSHPLLSGTASLLRRLAFYRFLESKLSTPPGGGSPSLSKRVSLEDRERNLEAIARICREHGIDLILIDLNLTNTYGLEELRRVAHREGLPLLETPPLFDPIAARAAEARTRKLGLDSPAGEGTGADEVVLRVEVPHPENGQPRAFGWQPTFYQHIQKGYEMYDDGTHGDERSGDHVYSLALPLARSTELDYAFALPFQGAPSAAPYRRLMRYYHRWTSEAGGRRFAPVERLGDRPIGRFLIRYDDIHPNPEGHLWIARALLPLVEAAPSFQRWGK